MSHIVEINASGWSDEKCALWRALQRRAGEIREAEQRILDPEIDGSIIAICLSHRLFPGMPDEQRVDLVCDVMDEFLNALDLARSETGGHA